MKKIYGFADTEEKETETVAISDTDTEEKPVKSLVKVFFPEKGREYAYYNDSFDLKCEDRVFVSGKLYGQLGVVTGITTHFRINTADYKKVIARPDTVIKGTFVQAGDKMVSFDTNMTPQKFRETIIAPPDPDAEPAGGEIIYGEGWSVELECFEMSEDIDGDILERALDLCREGKVTYISLCGGKGIAFISGKSYHTVEFDFDGETVSNLYCDCRYPDFCICKHETALLVTLKMLLNQDVLKGKQDFTAIDKKYLMVNTLNSGCQIKLD